MNFIIANTFPSYTCLVCGEKMPTVVRREIRGNIETGDYETDIAYFDTSKDNYFVRIDNIKVLEGHFNSIMEKLRVKEKDDALKDIENNASKKEFRAILKNAFYERIDNRIESNIEGFKYFVYGNEKFERLLFEPNFSVTIPCKESILRFAKITEEEKYVVNSGVKKTLRFKASLGLEEFPQAFPFTSEHFSLESLKDLKIKDEINLEFRHFSEFPRK
jgi:hypothetical protein